MITIDQCCFGAPSRKPTNLLGVRCLALRSRVAQHPTRGMCRHIGGHPPLEGRYSDGSWRTSAAKTYPPPLCRLIAEALFLEVSQRFPWLAWGRGELDPSLAHFHTPYDPYGGSEGVMGRDCMLHNRSYGPVAGRAGVAAMGGSLT